MPRKKVSKRKHSVGPIPASKAAAILVDPNSTDEELRSAAASILARRRAGMLTREELSDWGRRGGKNYWAKMSPAERTLEQKRRALVAKRNRRKKLRQKTGLE